MHKMLHIGMDAHRAVSQSTVMNEPGNVRRRKRVPSLLTRIRGALEGYRKPMKAVLEASYRWGTLYDWLTDVAGDVVLAHSAKVRATAEVRIKIEAETVARLLRADLLPAAYAPSKRVRAIK